MFKRGRLSVEVATEETKRYQEIPIQFVQVELSEAIRLYNELELYASDAHMLIAAHRHQAPLLTLDGSLREAAWRADTDTTDLH